MSELWDPSMPDVSYQTAPVKFPAFEYYKQQAQKAAEYINSIVLTDNNVKDVKKDLAAARKLTDGLDQKRIQIKNAILADYVEFESQVKELQAIVKDAESSLRSKVKELEERERENKKAQILDIWNKRYPMYQISEMLAVNDTFERWLTPQHLNKSTSMKSVEKEMTEWLENRDKDIESLRSMDDEYLVEYLGCLDLPAAISAVNSRNEIRSEIHKDSLNDYAEPIAKFIITGEKDIKLTELLLKENGIDYRKD